MNWKGFLGLVFVALGFILTIVAMATLSWYTEEYTATAGVDINCGMGLTQIRCCTADGSACATRGLDNDDQREHLALEGGKKVIGAGIVSLFMACVGFVCLFFAYKKQLGMWRMATIVSWIIAGSLAILAVILYSKKTVLLDYAFIIYLFSSFLALAGCTTILFGPGVSVK